MMNSFHKDLHDLGHNMTKSILVLEADEALSKTLRCVFEIKTYGVTCVATVQDARAALEAGAFDFMLMNGHGGRALVEEVLGFIHAVIPRAPKVVVMGAPGQVIRWRGEVVPTIFLPAPDSFEKLFCALGD